MLAGGLRHWGQLQKHGGEDQELILGCRSLTLGCHFCFEFSSTRIKYAVVLVVSTFVTTLRSCVLVVDVTADGNNNEVEETMEVGDIMMYPFS